MAELPVTPTYSTGFWVLFTLVASGELWLVLVAVLFTKPLTREERCRFETRQARSLDGVTPEGYYEGCLTGDPQHIFHRSTRPR